MKFYGLHEGYYEGVQKRIELIQASCDAKGIEFVCIDSLGYDHTCLPNLGKGDLLYSFSSGSQYLESLLLNDEVTTFYIRNPKLNQVHSTSEWSIIHDKAGIPAPKTIYHLTADRALLKKYIEYLGGFPIIIKATIGSRGIGTIKVDTWQNLISTADYLMSTGNKFIMREFILAEYGARIMVLGDKIILSARFFFQENDFRNAPILSQTRYEPMTINEEAAKMCVNAVHLANLEMAGVDLLFDKDGKPYLLEINFPTGFQSFKDDPMPILGQMLDYLINKSKKNDQ